MKQLTVDVAISLLIFMSKLYGHQQLNFLVSYSTNYDNWTVPFTILCILSVGIIITLIIIELIGRKITMAIEFICTGISIGLLLVCVPE